MQKSGSEAAFLIRNYSLHANGALPIRFEQNALWSSLI